jgi:hypothetical protein
VPNDVRVNAKAYVADLARVAYSNQRQEYLTWGFSKLPYRYNGHGLNHTREAALDRELGALFIFDTIISEQDFISETDGLSFGPLYHISEVLRHLDDGVIGQDGLYYQYARNTLFPGSSDRKSAPFVLRILGPINTTVTDQYWLFYGQNSGNWSQRHHVYGRWAGGLGAGQPISFLTAIVPFSAGAMSNFNLTAADLDGLDIPSFHMSVSNGTGHVVYGNLTLQFGPSTVDRGQPAIFQAKVTAGDGSSMQLSAVLDDANHSVLESVIITDRSGAPGHSKLDVAFLSLVAAVLAALIDWLA